MRYKGKSSVNPKTDNAVVYLGRLPKWISEQKTVKVLIKSQGCVITSLPSSPVWKEYRTMNSFCGKNLSQSPNQNLVDGRRMTRSTGGNVKVDFMAKLPDDRNYRCKILGACSDRFLGFEVRHHAIYLLNNDAFPCLSELQDKVDYVLSMAITEARCSDEGCKECPLVEDVPELTASDAGGRRHRKLQGKEGKGVKPKKCGQVKRKGAQCSSSGDVPLGKGKEGCGKDFCRLGCMCDSLKAKRKRVHCGHADCMFSKHCVIGPNFTPRDSSRLTLLSAEAKSPETEGGLAKRQRRPPKRWLEEEEEHDILAEVKKKSKLFVQKSPPESKEAEEAEGSSELITDTNHPEINEKSSEPNSRDESAFKLKRPICVAIKSISGKQRFKSSLFRYSVPDEPFKAHCSREGNLGESSSNFYSTQKNTHTDKPSCSKDSSHQDIRLKKYFKNYKEYRKFFASGEVTDSQIACMLSSSLRPAQVNCMVVMKWDVLEKMVKERLAHLWVSQMPKCPVKIMVTDTDSPPDLTSTNLAKVENVGGFVSSVDYLFHLYKNNPERYGCCILSCHGLHWEIKGNLNLRTKLSGRILIKAMRSCSKVFNELTFDNGGKRILICDSSSLSYTEEALGDNDSTDEAIVESEINEIPEPDIQVYDPAAVQSTGTLVCPARNSAHSKNTSSSPVSLAVENDLPSPSSEDTTSASETHRQASPDSTVSEKSHEEEVISSGPQSKPLVIPAPTSKGFLDLSWYCLNLDRSFDKIIIDKPQFSATYTQMVYALQVSKERDIAVRISCSNGSNYLFNSQIWKQGVYADYVISDISVKVGPYYNYEVPEIRAFVKVNGILIRTHVELSKEPLTPETMPRVSRMDSRTPARQTAHLSVSLLKSSSSRGMSEASSFGKNTESLSTRKVIDPLNRTTEPPTSVGEKRTATDDLPVVTSTVNESLTQADTMDETDDPCSMSSVAIKKEPREEMDSELSDESKSDFSMKIESVQGNWSGFDDIMDPTHDVSTDFGAGNVAKECTDSSETRPMKSLSHVSGTAARVVLPSSSNSAAVQQDILSTEMSTDSLAEVEYPKCAESRSGIRQVAAVLDPLMDTKSNGVTSKRADSISPRDVNSIADNSVTIKTFPVASEFRDSGSVCQVNRARRTVDLNSVASSVASEGNPSSTFIAERFRLIDENGLNAAVVLKLSPFSGALYADRVSKSDTKPVVSNSVAMESPASDTIITKRTSSVAPMSIELPDVCAANPVSDTSTAQRTNSVALACAESKGCAVNPLSDTIITKRTSKGSPSYVESSGSRAVNSSSDASVTKTSNIAAAVIVDSTAFSAVTPSSVSSVAEGAGTVAPMSIECTGVRVVDPSPDISVSRRANTTAAMPVDSTDPCAVNSLSGTLITKRKNVMATVSAESTDVNPFSDTSTSYGADSVAMNSKESSALELTSKSGTMRARRSKSVASVSKESARQMLNRKSDDKRTKLDAAKCSDLAVYKGECLWDDGPSDSCKVTADATAVKGFLVSDLKCLKAIAVTKTASNVIRFADPSWHQKDIPLEFRCEEEASTYLNTFTNVKMYPDDYVLKWTFVESKRFFQLKHGDDLIDIRTVDDGDHFITSTGVFRYDDLTADNLAKCGLDRDDNRRLLELRRRREIRSAKNELINLLPDPMKTDVLMKVIYRRPGKAWPQEQVETQQKMATGGGLCTPPVGDHKPDLEKAIRSECKENDGDDFHVEKAPVPSGSRGHTERIPSLEASNGFGEASMSNAPCAALASLDPERAASSSGGVTRGEALERELEVKLEGLKSKLRKGNEVGALRLEGAEVGLAVAMESRRHLRRCHDLKLQIMQQDMSAARERYEMQMEIVRLQMMQKELALAHIVKQNEVKLKIEEIKTRQMMMSWSLIHSLEEKGRALCQTLVTENTRKGFLLAKLRSMCSGETMYKIYEELEKIARPRVVADLDYVAPVQRPIPRKQRAPRQRRKPKKRYDLDSDNETEDPNFQPHHSINKGKPRAASSKAVRKSSKRGVTTLAGVSDQPVKTIKVLKPVVRTVQVHPLAENSAVKEEKATMLPPLSFLPVFKGLDEPPVKVFDELPLKELDEPPMKVYGEPPMKVLDEVQVKVLNEARVKVLNEPPVKVLEESVIKKHKQPKLRSAVNRNREMFSGRYVSAATKRSLRKYKFIIPCLARKHHSLLKKSSPDTVDSQKLSDTHCDSVSHLLVSNEGSPGKKEENEEGVRDEGDVAGVRVSADFDRVGKFERPPDGIAPNFEADEGNYAEPSDAGCGDESMVLEENDALKDEFCSREGIAVSVKQEVEDYDEEANELIQEDLEALPSEESDIEVD